MSDKADRTFNIGGRMGGGGGDVYLAMCYLKLLGPEPILVRYVDINTYYTSLAQELFTMMPNVTFEATHELLEPLLCASCHHPRRQETVFHDPVKLVTFAKPLVGEEPGFPQWNIPPKPELPKSYSVLAPQAGRAGSEPLNRSMNTTEIEKAFGELEHPVVLLGGANCPPVKGTIDLRGKTSIIEAIGIISRAKRFTGEHGILAFAALSQKVPSCLYIQRGSEYMGLRVRLMRGWVQYCTDVRNHEGK